jgi:hypothetical protein
VERRAPSPAAPARCPRPLPLLSRPGTPQHVGTAALGCPAAQVYRAAAPYTPPKPCHFDRRAAQASGVEKPAFEAAARNRCSNLPTPVYDCHRTCSSIIPSPKQKDSDRAEIIAEQNACAIADYIKSGIHAQPQTICTTAERMRQPWKSGASSTA